MLSYNPKTGQILRSEYTTRFAGACTSGYSPDGGVMRVFFEGRSWAQHRLAFKLCGMTVGKCLVIHKNGYQQDNRWENLELVSRKVRATARHDCVCFNSAVRKWVVRIRGEYHYFFYEESQAAAFLAAMKS